MRPWAAAGTAVAVTGAASGIGRALCQRLAAAGASRIFAIDQNVRGANETCDLIAAASSSSASLKSIKAVHCDVSDERALRAALREAADLQPLDLFAANAGIATIGDCSTPVRAWQRAWDINVMQIVTAADELTPTMHKRGGGAFLVTASAAGLLTQLGSAPYAVTKHAAVALAEWLAITHGQGGEQGGSGSAAGGGGHERHGITVSCVCPQGVRTPMIEGLLDGPSRALALDGLLEAEEVADEALACLAEGRFLCMPGGEAKGPQKHVARKAQDRERWVEGMQRLQAKLLLAPKQE